MWQAYVFASLVTSAAQNVVDKAAMTRFASVGYDVATFWRTGLFLAFTLLVGWSGALGSLRLVFTWPLVAFALLLCVPSSFFYTHLLKRVEVTGSGVVGYLAPLVFLAIDTAVLRVPLSAAQVAGVALLAVGGFGFALDGETRRIRSDLTRGVLGIFAFNVGLQAAEFYLFKSMAAVGVNGVSFFASTWLLVVGAVLLVIVLRGRGGRLLDGTARAFARRTVLSKACDTAASLFWVQALTMASVSQVSALEAVSPLVLLAVAVVAQRVFRVDVGERVTRAHLAWKAGAMLLLCAGGFLVR